MSRNKAVISGGRNGNISPCVIATALPITEPIRRTEPAMSLSREVIRGEQISTIIQIRAKRA